MASHAAGPPWPLTPNFAAKPKGWLPGCTSCTPPASRPKPGTKRSAIPAHSIHLPAENHRSIQRAALPEACRCGVTGRGGKWVVKQLLNTLYVTTQGAYLSKDGETVLVRVEKETRLRVPVHTLSGIVCFGQVSCSPPLMGFCAEKDVALSFLTEHGKFLARVQGPVNGNVLLRREQYRRADDDAGSTNIARAVVQAKIANCRTVLLRGMREHGGNSQIEDAASRLARSIEMLETAQSVDGVRGIEGDGARNYFFVFDHLITTAKEHFFFRERSRRPPLDKVNALLSFLYKIGRA